MRPIKLRQPIFLKGKFQSWHYWGFISDGNFVGPETNLSTIREAEKNSQQFTDLNDKNGKEVYEGDIVKDGEFIGKVFFKNGSFCVSYINTPQEFGDEYYPVYNKMNTHEVIGNIYESPKLMEVKE
uniref:Putative YopX protein n=2 Tax=viral metagenome TaxID=1070528 RepID=A0A6M3XXH4_9ZZZZ